MEWSGCIKMMQGYLENSPLIILGSGASMPYGLPSMGALADKIKEDPTVISDAKYDDLCSAIDSLGLEGAIDSVKLSSVTLDAIRKVTWNKVNDCDLKYFNDNPTSPPNALVELLNKVIAPTPNAAGVLQL
ncbi:MAG: hypothetical protein E7467_04510 [Ruminococcaceae bacterium]|nr:hypothetical protein [Oscillospiraceae bacterium]